MRGSATQLGESRSPLLTQERRGSRPSTQRSSGGWTGAGHAAWARAEGVGSAVSQAGCRPFVARERLSPSCCVVFRGLDVHSLLITHPLKDILWHPSCGRHT